MSNGPPCWVNTPLGEFRCGSHDHMVRYLGAADYEPEVLAAIQERVRPGDKCCVVGANVGYFTRALLDAAGETGSVTAVEPNPVTYGYLVTNCPGADAIQACASDYEGEARLWLHPGNSGDCRIIPFVDDERGQPCRVRRMDSLCPGPDFALVDAQGHDAVVMVGWFPHVPAQAIVEHWPDGIREQGRSPSEDLEVYEKLGYDVTPLGDDDDAGHRNLLLTLRA